MKKFKYFLMLLAAATLCGGLQSCSKDDKEVVMPEPEVAPLSPSDAVVGTYVGTLGLVGYADKGRAYVYLTRKSNDSVVFSIESEEFESLIPSQKINLIVTPISQGGYSLTSESNLVVDGTVRNGVLNLTFQNPYGTWKVEGLKE